MSSGSLTIRYSSDFDWNVGAWLLRKLTRSLFSCSYNFSAYGLSVGGGGGGKGRNITWSISVGPSARDGNGDSGKGSTVGVSGICSKSSQKPMSTSEETCFAAL